MSSDDPKLGILDCNVFAAYTPRFYNMNVGGYDWHKAHGGLNCGIKPTDRLSLRATLNFFPDGAQQQPWDPDFTYSLLYKPTKDVSFELSNYSGTRWPWNKREGQSNGWDGYSAKFRILRKF
ncbi:hypothetical protein [Jiella sonneratiae]|uniref:Uncharacterized protein n=1 Tax=Jiella sonneratiae TaxID=2816856 RepID=A0ABS3J576_9HYPH|nr:hypothetical protein [Jiella sonneratiae]MBO0904835.1 hypothetical protein [Jiella sonneratiae]